MKNQESLTSSGGAFSMISNDKKHESIGRNVINSFLMGHIKHIYLVNWVLFAYSNNWSYYFCLHLSNLWFLIAAI